MALLPIIECWKIYRVLRLKYWLFIHFFLIWKHLHHSIIIWIDTFQTCEHNCFLFCLWLNFFRCLFSSAKFQVCIINLSLRISKILNKLIYSFYFFLAAHFSSKTLNGSMILYLNWKFFLVICIKIRWLHFVFIIRRFIRKILILSIRSFNISIWANTNLTYIYWCLVLNDLIVSIIRISRYLFSIFFYHLIFLFLI